MDLVNIQQLAMRRIYEDASAEQDKPVASNAVIETEKQKIIATLAEISTLLPKPEDTMALTVLRSVSDDASQLRLVLGAGTVKLYERSSVSKNSYTVDLETMGIVQNKRVMDVSIHPVIRNKLIQIEKAIKKKKVSIKQISKQTGVGA